MERAQNASQWSGLLSRSLADFEIETTGSRPFVGELDFSRFGDATLIQMATERHIAHRTAQNIQASMRPEYLVCVQLTGAGEFHQDQRSAVLAPGDVTLFDTTRPTTVVSSDGYRNICVKIPQDAVPLTAGEVGQLTAVRISPSDGLAQATRSALLGMSSSRKPIRGRGRYLAGAGIVHLVSTMLHLQLGSADEGRAGYRRMTFDLVTEYIERNLADPDLSPAGVAAANFISLRQLQELFQENAVTACQWIRTRRLERCRRELATRSDDQMSVAAVGLRWGFRTPSHFGRVFKDAYGVTPAGFRRQIVAD
ncbi:MAG: hypothetical protein ABS81_08480 [Pseudonocardia sp. SCN 72-86]|nr:MAG: hypothetical protein ABS81_08480 [Pseudonocardia sp. SCN 72-86]